MYFVYVLKNSLSEKIYIGQTRNLEERVKRHNKLLPTKHSSYTSRNKGNWSLVYKEEFSTREKAIKREKELKSYRGREHIRSVILGL